MTLTNDDYNNWQKMAKYVITNSKYYSMNLNQDSTDLVHNLYERFIRYKVDQDDINDSYIYMSLKNLWNDTIRKRIKEQHIISDIEDHHIKDEDIEYDFDNDLKMRRKLNYLNDCLKNMSEEYQQIYFLYFIKGMSQAKIASAIHKSKSFIQCRVVSIREFIELEIKKKNMSI